MIGHYNHQKYFALNAAIKTVKSVVKKTSLA
jgi:hypothetical protein